MVSAGDIVTLLSTELDADALKLGTEAADYTVVEQNVSIARLMDQYLLKCRSPSESRVDVLFTVREGQARARRYLSDGPHTDEVPIEIGVWCTILQLSTAGDYSALRSAAVEEVKRVFKANHAIAEYQSTRVDDHTRGQIYVLCTIVTVAAVTES